MLNERHQVLEELFAEEASRQNAMWRRGDCRPDGKLMKIAEIALGACPTTIQKGAYAAKLLGILPSPVNKDHFHLPTWKYLINAIFNTWRYASSPPDEKEMREILLNLPAHNSEINRIFEAIVRENFATCEDEGRFLRLLVDVTPQSNKSVVRKAAQTAITMMDPEAIAFSFGCWSAAKTGFKSSGSIQYPSSLVHEPCGYFIKHVSAVAAYAMSLREHLPHEFTMESGCSIKISKKADQVTFTWKTARREHQKDTREPETYIQSEIFPKAREAVTVWKELRRMDPRVPPFGVTITVYVMSPSWTPDDTTLDKLESHLSITID